MTTVLDPAAEAGEIAAELAAMPDEALAGLADVPALAGPVAAERKRRADPAGDEWRDMAHAQYLAADAACAGHLLKPHFYERPGITDWPGLWSGPDWLARRHASEELNEFWNAHPRITVTGYRDASRHDMAAARAAWKEANDERNDWFSRRPVDGDEARGVRLETIQPTAAGLRSDSGRHAVPPPAARAGAGTASEAAGRPRPTVAGRTGAVRSPVTDPAAELARRAAAIRGTAAPVAETDSAAGWQPGTDIPPATESGTVALRPAHAVTRQRAEVDGGRLLDYTAMFLAHMAVWPSSAALDTVTAWIAHAHARDASGTLTWLSSPRLLFSSAEPGAGKSQAMRLANRLCPAPAYFTEPSEPAVAHAIGKDKATLALDEIDVLFGRGQRKAAIRAVINDGYTPDGEWARVRSGHVDRISTFGALMLAGLDKVETATDGHLRALLTRCIRIRMTMAPEGWRPPRIDSKAKAAAAAITSQLTLWGTTVLAQLGDDAPEMPDGIGNRQAQLWEPLIAVGDAASPEWGERIRAACTELVRSGMVPDDDEDALSPLEDWFASLDGAA